MDSLSRQGSHVYTFKNVCVDDGATTIFLNTKGKDNAVSPRLKAFLELVEGQSSDNDFVKRLEERLAYAKQDKFLRQEYLLTKFDRNECREEGRKERQVAIVNHMRSTGLSLEEITSLTLHKE